MINLELQEILGKLEQGLTAEFTKTVDGQTYTRVFLPKNRLILPEDVICSRQTVHSVALSKRESQPEATS